MSLGVNKSQNHSNLSFSLKVHITSFSKKQISYDFNTILYPDDFSKIDHLIQKSCVSGF